MRGDSECERVWLSPVRSGKGNHARSDHRETKYEIVSAVE